MKADEILNELKLLGKDSYKRVLVQNHGVKEPCFGVPISELKKIQKRIKQDYQLALDLYDSGNYDAMYLAGLIADDARMTNATCNDGPMRLTLVRCRERQSPRWRPVARMDGRSR